ncbi:oxoglutarate-dependent flavonoid 7-O-demethylase 1-like [Magnolia sinica]|uniref:oxoglutarate-dependent flavonoid 7-O-demethylase 1-like n=1 Tax=Magnolia sinica TaxID=86752 RepID=UPI002657D995|nr:oxoglutarate-dependent flavonoid 7-O-demethylase 1-like [Magnolia sinica]
MMLLCIMSNIENVVQLVNHGVSSTLVEKMKLEIQEFFKLPLEEKKKYCQKEGDVEGLGQAFVVSEEQKLDWGDMFFLNTLPPHLRKPHLFDDLPPSFRETLGTYAVELKKLAMAILGFMARALGMKVEEMRELFEEGFQSMRINYFPPCPRPESVIGLSPHSDSVGLTILLQISEIEGLQIKKDRMWIPVKPRPNAFIINIGDILEIVSNGVYRSIKHRATVNSMHERLSIAAFYSPKLTGDIGPAPSLISPQTPPQFRHVSVETYFKELFTRKLAGKAYVDYFRIDHGEGNASTN